LEVDGWSKKDLPRIQKLLANVTCLELVIQIDRKKKVKSILPTDLSKLILAAHGLKSLTFPAEILCRDLSAMFDQDFCVSYFLLLLISGISGGVLKLSCLCNCRPI
jgi:hypothetical protein